MLHDNDELHQELPKDHPDPLISFYHKIIQYAVKLLAGLMVLVIIWGVGDVIFILYEPLMFPPFILLNINDNFYVFGTFKCFTEWISISIGDLMSYA